MLVRDKLTWEDVCSDPSLRDLPFKIELNRLNQIVMSRAHPRHSRLQSKIARILRDLQSDVAQRSQAQSFFSPDSI